MSNIYQYVVFVLSTFIFIKTIADPLPEKSCSPTSSSTEPYCQTCEEIVCADPTAVCQMIPLACFAPPCPCMEIPFCGTGGSGAGSNSPNLCDNMKNTCITCSNVRCRSNCTMQLSTCDTGDDNCCPCRPQCDQPILN